MIVCTHIEWPKSYYQPLFDHMLGEHGLTLLDGEMEEICYVVDRMKGGDARMAAKKVSKAAPKKAAAKGKIKKK